MPNKSSSRKHRWLIGSERNPKHAWHWDNFFVDPDHWSWPGLNWIKSYHSLKLIEDMRVGDTIVAYQTGEGGVGLIYLSSDGYPKIAGGRSMKFDMSSSPVVRLQHPVPYATIRDLPAAKEHIEFLKTRVKQGPVFSMDTVGFGMIVVSMEEFNPKQSEEIDAFLSNEQSEVVAVAANDAGILRTTRKTTLALQRVIRDSVLGRNLKRLYGYQCQVCGTFIELLGGERYAEIHHLRPIGKPHNGKDGKPNTIVVCPQHHAMFDLGAIAIDPETLRLKHWNPDAKKDESPLHLKHRLDKASLKYHYRCLFRGQSEE